MSAKFLLISNREETTWPQFLRQILTPLGGLELVVEELASKQATQVQYDVILVDMTAIKDALSLVSRLRHLCPHTRIVVATASPTWQRAREVMQAGASDYIRKALNKEEILTAVKDALSQLQPGLKI